MAARRVEIGTVGHRVRENIHVIRRRQGLTLRELSNRMADSDHPMAHNTISDIENGGRRVDVDDLAALATALGVSSAALLGESDDPQPSALVTRAEVEEMLRSALG